MTTWKYFTTSDYNKSSSEVLDAKMKEKRIATNSELKAEENKIAKH